MLKNSGPLIFSLVILTAIVPMVAAADDRQPKVLLLGLDGTRANALELADTPNIDSLIENGCYTDAALTGDVTVSGPGWSSILCGVWRDKHDVPDNDFRHPKYDDYPSIFTLIKRAKPNLQTAAFLAWEPLHKFTIYDDACDHKVFHPYDPDGDVKNVAAASEYLPTADVDFVFFYFSDIDTAGHTHGFHPSVPEYIAEIEQVDGQVGQLLDAVRSREDYADEDWLIIATTDHGGTLDKNHGRNEPKHRTIFYLVSGDGADRGRLRESVNQVDVVPTALQHLGITVDPEWNLDGRVVGLKLPTQFGTNLIYNGNAEQQHGNTDDKTTLGIAGWHDTGAMHILQYGSPNGYPNSNSPGPDQRGNNFFAGGSTGDSVITQRIDLSDIAKDIDRDEMDAIKFEFAAWLGGYAEQRDMMTATCFFLNDAGHIIEQHTIGPVTLEDRRAAFAGETNLLGLLRRSTSGHLPRGTRIVEIMLEAEVGEGSNDGYADNVSFVLMK